VGAEINWNLPQIWRSGMPDDRKLVRALSTKGLVDALEAELGPYADGQNDTLDGDEIRARFAMRLLQTRKPAFMTVYLTALDTQQHRTGPFSPEVHVVLERLDAWVGALRTAMKGRGVLCVVSDHGFRSVQEGFELRKAFGDLGLFKKGDKSWELALWNCGGSFAVMLRDPSNHELQARVKARLEELKRDPAVDCVLDRQELEQRRGFPGVPCVVVLKPGYYAKGDLEPFVEDLPPKGAHGYLPEDPEMEALFLVEGEGIPKARNLGPIDMRQIAPTLAKILDLRLKGAEVPALSFVSWKP
jgi:predicted AlkP superfamily pyrophosphatase or phosphodiesterase